MAASSADVRVRSFGGAETVTGSCHLVEVAGARVLVDCGAFQGSRALTRLNDGPLGFEPREIDAVLLTHAHLDHCGRLPVLVNRGFRGRIHALPATRMLAELILEDSAKLHREDAERDRRHGRTPHPAAFDEKDVQATLGAFAPIAYDTPFEVAGLRVTAQPAGHIPGSASFLIEAGGTRLVMSGDLGNARKDVMPDPRPCPPADVVVMESTYGDRDHRPFDETLAELADVLRRAAERRGKILIPSFAVERAQEVLYHVARLEEAGEVPVLPVYVDSPMAARVEEVYRDCGEEFSAEVQAFYGGGRDPFRPRRLTYTRTVDDSKAINASAEPAIVIAGSGMLSGGRILHHLVAHLDDPHATVLIVGYQPRGGLGRQLVDRVPEVRIMGKQVRVHAQVATIGGLSAHADRTELLEWVAGAGPGARIRLAHGEPSATRALVERLRARGADAAAQPSEIELPDHGGHEAD